MRYFLFLLALLFFSCTEKSEQEENEKVSKPNVKPAKKDSVITLEIHAKKGEQFFLAYTDSLFNFNIFETPEKLKSDSVLRETIISQNPVMLRDIHWRAQNYIYLIPGEKYRITQDSVISHFEIPGNEKRTYELNAMKELKKHIQQQKRISDFDVKDMSRYQIFAAMDFKSRDSVLKHEYEDDVAFLDRYASKNDFSHEQKNILKRNIYYQYQNRHFAFNKKNPGRVKKYLTDNKALHDELLPLMQCDSCFEDPDFPYLAQSFAKNYVADPQTVGTEIAYVIYRDFFKGKTRDYLLYNLIKLGGMFNTTKPDPKLAKQFVADAGSPVLKAYIKEMYDFLEAKKSSTGLLANAAGDNISWNQLLEKHRNNVIYIDFWASWCGPCRAEAPAAKLLRKRFEGKDVVFLTISIDDNVAAWKKASKADGIDNPQNYILIQPSKSDLKKQYQINAIPRYFLINKSGKVINSNAVKPSDQEVDSEIGKLL